ncbi:glucosyltransferase domain-containing protein [Butyrivibrio sp. MB2005]|uniref:glucosyltransferase domain-containing protein n=1 Tax=Butyrivibrio sp. MB2005 TaxID=1280678 RepID=UPI000403FFA2|nr:glucosyltransferase domain-containing protein [Butyrivibrio sp. MB2005]
MKRFISEKRYSVILSVAITVLLYYSHAMSTNIGIDAEQFIGGDYGKEWLLNGLGRFGFYYSSRLINIGGYNVYLNGLLFLMFFSAATVIWCYVLEKFSGGWNGPLYPLFSAIFVSYPIWMNQFYFSHQQASMTIALFLQSISFALLFDVLESRCKSKTVVVKVVISVLFAVWAFGTYQSFAGMHLACAAACLMLYLDVLAEKTEDHKEVHKAFWKAVLIFAIHFIVSFIIYEVILKVFNWGSSDYLSFGWETQPFSKVVRRIFRDLQRALLGQRTYSGYILLAGLVVIMFIRIVDIVRGECKFKGAALVDYFLILVGNLLAMISLNIVTGNIPATRARFMVAFTTAFIGTYAVNLAYEKREQLIGKCSFSVLVVVVCISLFMQVGKLQKLIYTNDVCNSQQYEVGSDLVSLIKYRGGCENPMPTFFIGRWEAPLNAACEKSAQIGESSFAYRYDESDKTSGSRRSALYLNAAFGTEFINVEDEAMKARAVEIGTTLDMYPSDGCVYVGDDIIVVKLSE